VGPNADRRHIGPAAEDPAAVLLPHRRPAPGALRLAARLCKSALHGDVTIGVDVAEDGPVSGERHLALVAGELHLEIDTRAARGLTHRPSPRGGRPLPKAASIRRPCSAAGAAYRGRRAG